MKEKKKIAITMGEPCGVGPEIIIRALHSPEIRDCCIPLVIGDVDIMKEAVKITALPVRFKTVNSSSKKGRDSKSIDIFNVRSQVSLKKRTPSISAGKSVVKYIKKAVELALKHEVDAVVTAPVSKESLKMAGYHWPGHTEMLADLTNSREYAMMFVSDDLNVILTTIHISLREVPGRIERGRVFRTIRMAKLGGDMLGMSDPRIAVAGVNPHAGEAGIMGREELAAILPAVEKARAGGINVSGPHPPDVVFYRALKGYYDIVVCMYHDQGSIPFKLLAFEKGVNMTVGLPVIRTSPDHGTAFDIAWQNKANPASMIEAIKLASRLKISNPDS